MNRSAPAKAVKQYFLVTASAAALPYGEEMLRDWRAHPGRLKPPAARAA